MKPLRLILSVALLSLPMLGSAAKADNATASQISAAGHGRHAMTSNRPSRQMMYHRHQMRHPMAHRHHRGARY